MTMERLSIVSVVLWCLLLSAPGCKKAGGEEGPQEPKTATPQAGATLPTTRTDAQIARDAELAKEAAFFIDLYTNDSPALSNDGSRLAFVSNREGISAVYAAAVADPSGAPVRLSDLSQRALQPRFTPDGTKVLYLSDVGADEKYRIWSVDAGGGAPVCLTPEGDLWRDPPLVTADGKTMVYTAAELKETETHLYAQPLEAGGPKEIVALGSRAFIEGLSDDGGTAVLIKEVSFSDTELLAVDVKKSTMLRLYPPEGKKAAVSSAALSADGKTVFAGTDGGGDSAFIVKLDAQTGKQKGIFKETKTPLGSFDGLRLVAGEKKLLAVLSAGDHDEVRVLDAKTMGLEASPLVPLGMVWPGMVAGSSGTCPVMMSVPDAPKDVFLFDVKTSAFTPARKETRPELEKIPKVDVEITAVPSADGVQVPLIVYLPKNLPAGAKLPVVVKMHGGPASSSSVNWDPMRLFLMSKGYAFLEPNVRGSWGFGRAWEMADNGKDRMKSVEDMGAVGTWAAGQPWADPGKLVVYGGSYGGYMVLMGLAFQSEIWAAGVDFVGVSSIRTLIGTTSGSIRELLITEFGEPSTEGGFLDYVSPLTHAGEIVDPLFVYQGENDPRVPRSESDQIVGALLDRGIKVEYMIMEKEGHSIDRRESKLEFVSRAARFLEEVLTPHPG